MSNYIEREKCDLEIDLTLLTPEEGGKTNSIRSGYRCTVYIARSDWVTSFYLQDRDWLYPGETGRVLVQTSAPHLLHEHLREETTLLLREGGRLIGRGHIVEILNLEQNAEATRLRWAMYEEKMRAEKEAAREAVAQAQELAVCRRKTGPLRLEG